LVDAQVKKPELEKHVEKPEATKKPDSPKTDSKIPDHTKTAETKPSLNP
jgi:hypothetical protein